MNYAAPLMRRRLLRGALCAAAILVTLVTDVAPHHHDDWTNGFNAAFSGAEIHDVDCRTPRSKVHLHADKIRHLDTCVACLRQHFQAISSIALVRVPQSLVCRITSFV